MGLLTGKKVVVAVSRGGFYAPGGVSAAMDFQEPYLRSVLGFLGLTDVSFIEIEGQAVGADAAAAGREAARAQVAALAPHRRAA